MNNDLDRPSIASRKHYVEYNAHLCSHVAYSEHDECLSNITFNSLLLNSQNIESNSLGDWSALTDDDDITNSDSWESWGEMGWQIVMSLLESIVLLDVMEVITSDDDGSGHLGGDDDTPIK